MRDLMFPTTKANITKGVSKFDSMLFKAKTEKDMSAIFSYGNLLIRQLILDNNTGIANKVFDDYWKKHKEIKGK